MAYNVGVALFDESEIDKQYRERCETILTNIHRFGYLHHGQPYTITAEDICVLAAWMPKLLMQAEAGRAYLNLQLQQAMLAPPAPFFVEIASDPKKLSDA